jgi:predicted DsbA family dithiol-disulfide isomerase
MDAYWTEARNIGDPGELRALAVEGGLEPVEVDEVLANDAYAERVRASTAEAHSVGINGIPAFALDGRLLILGAQPREVFERAYAQLAE